ncbi:MAG: D-Ala-D-Ala carboxypeptidase family metallohydrolase [Pseudomonadales bacterium]
MKRATLHALWCAMLVLSAALATAKSLPVLISAGEISGRAVHYHGLQPGQTLELIGFDQVWIGGAPAVQFSSGVEPSAGRAQRLAPGHHQLIMPTAVDHVALDYSAGARRGRLQLFPLAPLNAKTTRIEGYEIGLYPPANDRGQRYSRPDGLIRVTPSNQHQLVSPHFRLGQFLCKQEAVWPKFVGLQPALLNQLERLVNLARKHGVKLKSLHVMSGFRTPRYNRSLGNVAYSRHVYGDAADVFVDTDGDNWMDDLNGDGKKDVNDALWLLNLLEVDTKTAHGRGHVGGLSAYPATPHHGPFLHVDTRGNRARWGYQAQR